MKQLDERHLQPAARLRLDAERFEEAADRLRDYQRWGGWVSRKAHALAIGFLNGKAVALRQLARAYDDESR